MILNYFQKHASSIYIRLIILVHLIFSYNFLPGWWFSLTGTLIIIFLAQKAWGWEYKNWIGLNIIPRIIVLSLILLGLITMGSYYLITSINHNFSIASSLLSLTAFIHFIGYTLNEEILIGAILLKFIQKKIQILKRYQISILVAFVFSILHYIFYRWVFLDSGILTPITLSSLLAVGIIRNNLILGTGHIGYSWALHAGWIFVMFGFIHTDILNDHILNESERFNLYLGAYPTLLITIGLALMSFIIYFNKIKLFPTKG